MRMYCAVSSTASAGACMSTAMGLAKITSAAVSTTETARKKAIARPMRVPMRSLWRWPRYRPMRIITPAASWLSTKVTRFMMLLPVETPEMAALVPK